MLDGRGVVDARTVGATLDRAEASLEGDFVGGADAFIKEAEDRLRVPGTTLYRRVIQLISRDMEALNENDPNRSRYLQMIKVAEKHLTEADFEKVEDELQPLIRMFTGADGELGALLSQRSGGSPNPELIASPSRGATVGQAVRLSLPNELSTNAVVDWGFGDGTTAIGTSDVSKVHVYSTPAEYAPEATVHAENRVQTYTAHILIDPEPSAVAANAARRRRRAALLGVVTIAVLTASLSGLLLLYVGKPFGTLADYVVALSWGFGTERAVAQAGSRLGHSVAV